MIQDRLGRTFAGQLPIAWMLRSPLLLLLGLIGAGPVVALPPPEDLPEEVMRTEIITGARSPVDGKPLTAAEYVELQAQLQPPPNIEPLISPKLRNNIFLLRVRRLIRTVIPIPIKAF